MTASTGPLYGGWRERRGMGLAGLGGTATACVVGIALLLLLVAMVAPALAVRVLPIAVLPVAAATVRWRGESTVERILRRAAWSWARWRGHTTYRSGRGMPPDAVWNLPGPLAPVALLEVSAPGGSPFAVCWDRAADRMTAVLLVDAESPWLHDPDQVQGWVAAWHHWLAQLGQHRAVRHCSVTVETRPCLSGRIDDGSRVTPQGPADGAGPAVAQAVIGQLAAELPGACAETVTRVAITAAADRLGSSARSVLDRTAEFARLLDGLESTLPACGVSVAGRASVPDVVMWVRAAFDPQARAGLSAASRVLTWADARPMATQECWEHMVHDSGVSVSWAWDEAPRQMVGADVLGRLMCPGGYLRRVTMLYTPTPAHRVRREVDDQVSASAFHSALRSRLGRSESARQRVDREHAESAADAEARGAGVVDIATYVTATVEDAGMLASVVADVEHRAADARVRLRRSYGSQMAGFAAGLSVGVDPASLKTWS